MTKRICTVCRTSYEYCPLCEDKPYWMAMFHDENCKTIFNILQWHYLKEYSDRIAANKLKECDLSQIDTFDPKLKQQIQAILATQVKLNKKPIVNKKQESD